MLETCRSDNAGHIGPRGSTCAPAWLRLLAVWPQRASQPCTYPKQPAKQPAPTWQVRVVVVMGADHHHFTAAERRELFLQCAMGVLDRVVEPARMPSIQLLQHFSWPI